MADTTTLESGFRKMGARVKFASGSPRRNALVGGSFTIDVRRDRRGEFFEMLNPSQADELRIVSVDELNRHLLLLVHDGEERHRFLCGHDERYWFVAAVPGGASSVRQAWEALKPPEVHSTQLRLHLKRRYRERRRNRAFVRQGEWFFVPAPGLNVAEDFILRNEPLSRGGGSKPHRMEFCYRRGGVTVYVCSKHPQGILEEGYREIIANDPDAKKWRWQVMKRNPEVYARGRVRHPDHAVVVLKEWHRVFMNTENRAPARRHVVFLD